MRKIILTFASAVVVPEKTHEIDDAKLAAIEKESRWQLGTAVMLGVQRKVERLKQLGEWIYRFNGTLIDPKSIESYQSNEYMDWRGY